MGREEKGGGRLEGDVRMREGERDGPKMVFIRGFWA